MKLKESLAADYWIENTKRIYEENLHVSSPVMEAYQAGFEKAKELIIITLTNQIGVSHWETEDSIEAIKELGEDDESNILPE